MDKKIVKIIWTEDGINSFEEVVKYIYKDSPFYATNLATKILYSIEKLEIFPRIGRVVPEYNDPTIRELIHLNYRIVYKVKGNVIYLLLVIHGSHQLPFVIL